MHIEFLVEEYSAEAALKNLLPSILPEETTFAIRPFSGKQDLLSQLPKRLSGYQKWLPEDWRIVVLVDRDRENCRTLKVRLEDAARQAGLATKSSVRGQGRFDVVNRLAIEEIEAWYFGDPAALKKAYPRLPDTISHKALYRNPDAIAGGTWEALERILKQSGYYSSGMPKVETARNVSKYMDPDRNISKSFQVFRNALRELAL
jgi:hypothetical protein